MSDIGIRELKQNISDVLRRVRENKESIRITRRGRFVARLVPDDDLSHRIDESRAIWAKMDKLTKELAEHWPAGVSAVDAVKEQRR